jgi:holo-[acyl-carrier protein] synthase
MNVFGIGTDITETSRIEDMINKHAEIFLDRVYTLAEQEYCGIRKAAGQHYAGRWAAKEAILKSMGTGWAKGIHWTDCDQKGIGEILISISHCKEYATAFATALFKKDDS